MRPNIGQCPSPPSCLLSRLRLPSAHLTPASGSFEALDSPLPTRPSPDETPCLAASLGYSGYPLPPCRRTALHVHYGLILHCKTVRQRLANGRERCASLARASVRPAVTGVGDGAPQEGGSGGCLGDEDDCAAPPAGRQLRAAGGTGRTLAAAWWRDGRPCSGTITPQTHASGDLQSAWPHSAVMKSKPTT